MIWDAINRVYCDFHWSSKTLGPLEKSTHYSALLCLICLSTLRKNYWLGYFFLIKPNSNNIWHHFVLGFIFQLIGIYLHIYPWKRTYRFALLNFMKILISEDAKFQVARYIRMSARWFSDTLRVKLPVLTMCCSCRKVGSTRKQICCEENFQAQRTAIAQWR